MTPAWLHGLSLAYLLFALACGLVITLDLALRPQRMWIMNVVWPMTALFGTGWILWQYFRYGRQVSHRGHTPFPIAVSNGALHCGSGCALGDVCAEWLVFFCPAMAMAFGWHTVFSEKIFAVWVIDYLLAYFFGVVFQYFTIAPMRHLSLQKGLIAAAKADTLSLTAWQIGMYGFMALAHFWIFGQILGQRLEPDSFEFWFMMQVAMLCGFATSYPVNWWLIRHGLKEKM